MGILNRFLCAVLLITTFAVTPSTSFGGTFHNPIREGAPDPWLVTYKGYYYLTYTTITHAEIVKARSIAELREAKAQVIFRSSNSRIGSNIWAPELHRLKGPNGYRWYFYYTAGSNPVPRNQRNHVLESAGDDPMGPYTYKGRLFDPSYDVMAIDGNVLQKPDGSLYFLYSNWANSVRIAPMSNPWTVSGRSIVLTTAKDPWETRDSRINEAPEIIHRNGKYWVIHSGNHCRSPHYALGMVYADENSNLLDPRSWTKHRQSVFSKNDAAGVYGPGHNGFFKSPDGKEDWIIYHAVTNPNGVCDQTRSARAQKFTWNSDGSPNFGTPISLRESIKAPSGDPIVSLHPIFPTSEERAQSWKYSFQAPDSGWLGKKWFTPSYNDANWQTGQGGFGSHGTPGASIGTVWQTPNIWLRKTFNVSRISKHQLRNLVLRLHHDEDVKVYINGVLAAEQRGYSTKYFFAEISEAAKRALKPDGQNVIAVHCQQRTGGQYIDVGLYLRAEAPVMRKAPTTKTRTKKMRRRKGIHRRN